MAATGQGSFVVVPPAPTAGTRGLRDNPLEMYPLTKSGIEAIKRLIAPEDREEMLAKIESYARTHAASQIGANHVLNVVLNTKYYERFGLGLQGGPGSGSIDLPRDIEAEWNELLAAERTSARGSQLQVQIYTNRRPGELNKAVGDALPSLASRVETVGWVAPLERTRFAEPQDERFLLAVGWNDLADALKAFWPRGGPVWDALGVAVLPASRPGVVLAEGKSYPGELRGPGTKATPTSRAQILKAISWTQEQLGVSADPESWLGPHYQTANRLAHLCWLRSHGVEAWFVHLFFVHEKTHGRATSEEEWQRAWAAVVNEMGLRKNQHDWFGHVFLRALSPEELTRAVLPA